jgi:hypothetical protein
MPRQHYQIDSRPGRAQLWKQRPGEHDRWVVGHDQAHHLVDRCQIGFRRIDQTNHAAKDRPERIA